MVVLSTAIVSKSKTLLARQFVDMSRLRIEGLMSAFPKLIESESAKRDHTYIETDSVRYVYQPMESLFLLLVTNKTSNILEDLETLRLMAKVLQDCCETTVSEELILKKAFDIVFAFDEVISFGYRESVSLSQIKTYTEMDSHDEKIHQMIVQSKEKEALEVAKRRQKELTALRAQEKAAERKSGGMSKIQSLGLGLSSSTSPEEPSWAATSTQEPAAWPSQGFTESAPAVRSGMPKMGMSLKKKKPDNTAHLRELGISTGAADIEAVPEAAAPVNPLAEPVNVVIDEKVTAQMAAEGGLSGEFELIGTFTVNVLDPKADLVCFQLTPADPRLKYKVHPNLNKNSQTTGNVLEVRDASRAYKPNVPAPLLKWRMTSAEEDMLPFQISCWPSSTADQTVCIIEFEANAVLNDVHFRVPCPAQCDITTPELGQCRYDPSTQQVHWHIPQISNESVSLEFSTRVDQGALFPFTMEAMSANLTVDTQVQRAYHQATNDNIQIAMSSHCLYNVTINM